MEKINIIPNNVNTGSGELFRSTFFYTGISVYFIKRAGLCKKVRADFNIIENEAFNSIIVTFVALLQ